MSKSTFASIIRRLREARYTDAWIDVGISPEEGASVNVRAAWKGDDEPRSRSKRDRGCPMIWSVDECARARVAHDKAEAAINESMPIGVKVRIYQ